MFKNYLRTAWRNIIRQKIFSLIMICGLALSMSVCLLVIVIINDQLSFDKFHPNANNICRINTYITHADNNLEKIATAPFPLGDVLKNSYTSVESVVRVDRDFNADVLQGENKVALHGMFTEPSFFKVFGFTLQAGDASTALSEPNAVILTHETALKFFGNKNPVGKTISLQNFGDFKVTGVLAKIEQHSQLQFDALASVSSIKILEQRNVIGETINNLQNYHSGYLYVLLQQGKTTEYLNSILAETAEKLNTAILNGDDKEISFHAEHITGASKMSIGNNAIPANVLWVLSALGFIVIISACFNYTNLSIASSLSRSKEIGMRKTMGATRFKIFSQFILQSIIISLLSLVISIIAWRFLGEGFKRMVPQLNLNLQVSAYVYLMFLLFSIVIGIIAGLFPSAYLSAFKPIAVLKDAAQAKFFSKLPLRKALLLIQFTFCCIAVISVAVINKQMNYILNADYGFIKSNIINVDLQGMPHKNIMHEIAKYNGIEEVSASSGMPVTGNIDEVKIKKNGQEKNFAFDSYSVDENFTSNLNIHLAAGKTFSPEALLGKEKFVLLNEKAVQVLSFGNASDAIGKFLMLNDSNLVQVSGVVKDFNFLPLTSSISPLVLRANQSDFKYINIKFTPARKAAVIAFLNNTWSDFNNVHPLKFTYYDNDIVAVYQPYKSILTALSFIGLLAVLITCMGLLGIVIFTVRIRQKEIGIRKILGLNITGILLLISKSFLKLLVIASVIAIPASFLIGYAFLDEFAYRTNIGAGTIIAGISLIYFLVIATICSQTIKAAMANPAKSLRTG